MYLESQSFINSLNGLDRENEPSAPSKYINWEWGPEKIKLTRQWGNGVQGNFIFYALKKKGIS